MESEGQNTEKTKVTEISPCGAVVRWQKQRTERVKEKSQRDTDFSFRLVSLEIMARHLERHTQGTRASNLLDEKSENTSLDNGEHKGQS